MTKLLATSLDRKLKLKHVIDWDISLNDEELDKAMNHGKVWQQIDKVAHMLNTEVSVNPPVTAWLGGLNKHDWIHLLIKLRGTYVF